LPRAQTIWPTALGIVGLIYALFMLTCSCSAVFSPQIYRWQADVASDTGNPDPSAEIMADIAERHQVVYVVLGSLALLSTTLLLVSSIALFRRRAWARSGLLAWVGVEFVLTVVNLVFQLLHHARDCESNGS
jgi:hypothetical protein